MLAARRMMNMQPSGAISHLWAWGGPNTAHLFAYTIAANTWSVVGTYPDFPAGTTSAFPYGSDPANKRFFAAPSAATYSFDTVGHTWTTRAAIPTPLTGSGSCWYNGKLYSFGGHSSSLGTDQALVQIYDPATNSWSAGANMPTAIGSSKPVCAPWGTKIYVVGATLSGTTWTGHTMIYDVAGNSWTTGTNESTGMAYSAGGMINGKLYVCCGQQSGFSYVATGLAYDTASDSWSTIASMPAVQSNAAAVVANGSLYVHGGGANGDAITSTGSLFRYDPGTNSWTTLASSPQNYYDHGLAAA